MNNLFPTKYLVWSIIACVLFSPIGVVPVVLSVVSIIEEKSSVPNEQKLLNLKNWIVATVVLTFIAFIAIVTKVLLSILPLS